jgi:acetoin utilization deacetylase AcuC-like enzyme
LDANRNLPLAPGAGDSAWLEAVEVLCKDVAAHCAEALVVSLGLDAAASDPESPLRVSAGGYRRAAERIAMLAPSVVVQEGGYDLAAIGELVVCALEGLQRGS